nr:uncharacterized protein LOC129471239 [Symphalangus syndactylus]
MSQEDPQGLACGCTCGKGQVCRLRRALVGDFKQYCSGDTNGTHEPTPAGGAGNAASAEPDAQEPTRGCPRRGRRTGLAAPPPGRGQRRARKKALRTRERGRDSGVLWTLRPEVAARLGGRGRRRKGAASPKAARAAPGCAPCKPVLPPKTCCLAFLRPPWMDVGRVYAWPCGIAVADSQLRGLHRFIARRQLVASPEQGCDPRGRRRPGQKLTSHRRPESTEEGGQPPPRVCIPRTTPRGEG